MALKRKRKRASMAERLGCVRQLVLMGLLWGIFVGFNTLTRMFAPHLEFRLGQISVIGFVLAIAELLIAWWVSLKITNAAMGGMIARAQAREAERARLEEEAAASEAPPVIVEGEAAKEEQ